MMGLSTSGNISFGWALVAGKKRVPRPAAGKTALRTFMVMRRPLVVRSGCLLPADSTVASVTRWDGSHQIAPLMPTPHSPVGPKPHAERAGLHPRPILSERTSAFHLE